MTWKRYTRVRLYRQRQRTSNFVMRNTFPEIKYRVQYLGMRLFLGIKDVLHVPFIRIVFSSELFYAISCYVSWFVLLKLNTPKKKTWHVNYGNDFRAWKHNCTHLNTWARTCPQEQLTHSFWSKNGHGPIVKYSNVSWMQREIYTFFKVKRRCHRLESWNEKHTC